MNLYLSNVSPLFHHEIVSFTPPAANPCNRSIKNGGPYLAQSAVRLILFYERVVRINYGASPPVSRLAKLTAVSFDPASVRLKVPLPVTREVTSTVVPRAPAKAAEEATGVPGALA